MKKVNILGTEYSFIETTSKEDPRLEHADGWCGNYLKEILIESDIYRYAQGGDVDVSRCERLKYIRRHELVHAFFSESGLDDYNGNEQLVSWIAKQFPKMLKVFEEVDAM